MNDIIQLVGPEQTVQIFGFKLLGVSVDNAQRLVFTLLFILAVLLLGRLLRLIADRARRGRPKQEVDFWAQQTIQLVTTGLIVIGVVSIWFEDPTRLATAFGLATAGIALALQKVITSIAAYFVILRGKIYKVGDRIAIGGVRGDVVGLDFTQTTIMEMGLAPAANTDPAAEAATRQYTGRIVTISNARIFDDPVFNYTRDFPYAWEELSVPIPYAADRDRAEAILLQAAQRHTIASAELSELALGEIQHRFGLTPAELGPRVYCRLTDKGLELTVRFIAKDLGGRELKDAMTREILRALTEAGIGIAAAPLAKPTGETPS